MKRLLIACATLASAMLAAPLALADAAGGLVEFPGGLIDPHTQLFAETPVAAKAPAGCEVAARYVQLMDAGKYDQLAGLYAPDAVVFAPNGQRAFGRDQINSFYLAGAAKAKAQLIVIAYAVAPHQCFHMHAVKVAGDNRFRLGGIDHFTFDSQGRITRNIVFPPAPLAPAASQH